MPVEEIREFAGTPSYARGATPASAGIPLSPYLISLAQARAEAEKDRHSAHRQIRMATMIGDIEKARRIRAVPHLPETDAPRLLLAGLVVPLRSQVARESAISAKTPVAPSNS